MSNPIRKCLSLTHIYTMEGGANDWRYHGNSSEAVNSTTRWIKVWANWYVFQNGFPAPSSAAQSWDQLNAAPNGALQRLDSIISGINVASAQLQAQNGGNIGVILCVDSTTPTWATDHVAAAPYGFPRSVAGDSPWAWFIAHLCARYKSGAPISNPGPSLSGGNTTGNTAGAYISALEICNEANLWYHPQDGLHCGVASMIKTAEAMAAFWGSPPALMAPGLLDMDQDHYDANGVKTSTSYTSFTSNVLSLLQGFTPRMYFGWSHHNYTDCESAVLGAPATGTRVANLQNLLSSGAWKGGTDRMVWLTEGGCRTEPNGQPETVGRDRVYANYAQMLALPDVPMWCNHLIVDPPPMPNGFYTGFKRSDLSPKPLRDTWYAMPAANTALF